MLCSHFLTYLYLCTCTYKTFLYICSVLVSQPFFYLYWRFICNWIPQIIMSSYFVVFRDTKTVQNFYSLWYTIHYSLFKYNGNIQSLIRRFSNITFHRTTVWDVWEMQGRPELTLQQFLEAVLEKYKIKVSLLKPHNYKIGKLYNAIKLVKSILSCLIGIINSGLFRRLCVEKLENFGGIIGNYVPPKTITSLFYWSFPLVDHFPNYVCVKLLGAVKSVLTLNDFHTMF